VNPAPSVIIFSVLSGAGFGLIAILALWPLTFVHWVLAYALTVTGLIASTFHLGRPERAWRAFSQWRTSWLSREGVAAVATCLAAAPLALNLMPAWWGVIVAGLAAFSVLCTAMIYAQLRAVPRWNHWITPVLFAGFAATGGMILTDTPGTLVAGLLLAVLLYASFRIGDRAFARAGQTMGTATGLPGTVTVFAQPHTSPNYIMREMIFRVGRTHARRLRLIAILCAAVIPAIILGLGDGWPAIAPAFAIHLTGAFAARWLFFAEAEHVAGLYYGA
jgi:sulfite dehydrogenase (quinone) subunit SoeC